MLVTDCASERAKGGVSYCRRPAWANQIRGTKQAAVFLWGLWGGMVSGPAPRAWPTEAKGRFFSTRKGKGISKWR